MNKLVGYVSEGLPGTDGLTCAVSFEMYNQKAGERGGKLFVGKKIMSIKVAM